MPFMLSNVDQLREKNTLVLKYVFISSLAPDLSLIPKSMPDKIIILGFFKVFRCSFWETIHVFQSP